MCRKCKVTASVTSSSKEKYLLTIHVQNYWLENSLKTRTQDKNHTVHAFKTVGIWCETP
jgi:hypothetical protein